MKQDTDGAISSDSQRAVPVGRINVPVLVALGAFAAIVSWTWIAATQFATIHLEIVTTRNELSNQATAAYTELAKQIAAIQYQLKDQENRMSDRWTGTDHRRFVLDLMRANPNLKLPENQ